MPTQMEGGQAMLGYTLLQPAAPTDAIVYLPGNAEELRQAAALMEQRATLVALEAAWNQDLSPWPAEKVFRGEKDFSGGAAGYWRHLLEAMPAIEQAASHPVRRQYLAGYSLAGLFALWAAMSGEGALDGVASMSGSLWYVGFTTWAKDKRCNAPRVYLSLGDKEKNTRNPRMAQVERCTALMAEKLRNDGAEVIFRLVPGGHFRDVPERIAMGLDWLLEEKEALS